VEFIVEVVATIVASAIFGIINCQVEGASSTTRIRATSARDSIKASLRQQYTRRRALNGLIETEPVKKSTKENRESTGSHFLVRHISLSQQVSL
jgi:hypothetical protein